MSKATTAAKRQQRASSNNFDPNKLEILFESEPVLMGPRWGVINAQVYQYNNGAPKLGIYRTTVLKSGDERRVKDLCPMTLDQAEQLADGLDEAIKFLKNL